MENVKDELNETRDEKIDTKVSIAIRERVLKDINHLDRKKFEKTSIILEKIEESEALSLDQTSRLMVNQSSTGILVAYLLYDLQQITSKLSLKHYKVLSFLDISSQLTCNAYAKNFLAFSPNEKLQLFEDEPENEESGVSRTEESIASGDDKVSFEDAKTKSNRLARGQITFSHVKQLNKLYTKGSVAFGSIANLKKASGLPRSKVVQYIQSKAPYTKYKQVRKTFARLKAVAYRINEIWSVDVAFMDKDAQHNNGVKYLLVAVDALSRYLRLQPMKALFAKDAVEAFKEMIQQKKPEKVGTDKGSEFESEFKKFCEKKEINLYTTENETKSAFAEGDIRSLKNIIHKYLEENWTWTYIKELPQFVNTIKSRVNRVTQIAPNKIFKKHEPFLISLAISTKKYKPKYEEGDLVRIAKPDETFRRGYKQNYTDEVFTVFKVATFSPPTYNFIDANSVITEGNFYEPELVQVNDFPVED